MDVAEGVAEADLRLAFETDGYTLAYPRSLLAPVHEGSTSIWRLTDVLAWMEQRGAYELPGDVMEVARVAHLVNMAKEQCRLRGKPSRPWAALVA